VTKRATKLIESLIPVTTYNELDKWAGDFFRADSPIKLLIVLGPPGRQKSTIFSQYLQAQHLFIKGHVTGFELYKQLYYHLNEIVVFDDADLLLEDKRTRNLMKNLCETTPSTELMWTSGAADQLQAQGIPQRFRTSSRVVIIVNDIEAAAAALAPILSRGHGLWFNPSAAEMHRRVIEGGWFQDQEILDFIGQFIHVIADPDMRRIYQRTKDMKTLGNDWRGYLLNTIFSGQPSLRISVTVAIDPTLQTPSDRVERFIQLGGGSRATYYRRLGQLNMTPNRANHEVLRPQMAVE